MTQVATTTDRRDEQTETIKRLNALTSLDWTVDADGLAVEEYQGCANDTDHGLGTCYAAPDVDGLCPNCMISYLTQNLVAGSYIAVDVTR